MLSIRYKISYCHWYVVKLMETSLIPQSQYSLAWGRFLLFHANFTVMIHTTAVWLTLSLAVWRWWGRGALWARRQDDEKKSLKKLRPGAKKLRTYCKEYEISIISSESWQFSSLKWISFDFWLAAPFAGKIKFCLSTLNSCTCEFFPLKTTFSTVLHPLYQLCPELQQ